MSILSTSLNPKEKGEKMPEEDTREQIQVIEEILAIQNKLARNEDMIEEVWEEMSDFGVMLHGKYPYYRKFKMWYVLGGGGASLLNPLNSQTLKESSFDFPGNDSVADFFRRLGQ